MSTTTPTADLHIVVGYDGSPPAERALDAAVRLLRGRTGGIEVVYVAHLSSTAMLSAGAVAEIEAGFDQTEQELRTAAHERLRGQEAWGFQRRQGMIVDQLIAVANEIGETHPGDIVVIVVGSSSEAMHRAVDSVAVSLARHARVPLVIVP